MSTKKSAGFWVNLIRYYSGITSPIAYLVRNFILESGIFLNKISKKIVCIDIGSGTNPYLDSINKAFLSPFCVSVDIAPSENTSVIADACRLPFCSSAADVVVMFDVIQHISNPEKLLQKINFVLKREGLLLITFPFLYAECDFHDYSRWTMEGMKDLLVKQEFEIIKMRHSGGTCFAMACFLNWILQHLIPGQRQSWRARRTWKDILRLGVIMMITIPTTALAWLGLIVDKFLPKNGFYMGGAILVRKRGNTNLISPHRNIL